MNGYSITFSPNCPQISISRLFAAPAVLTNVLEMKIWEVCFGKVKSVGQVLLPGQAGSVRIRRFLQMTLLPLEFPNVQGFFLKLFYLFLPNQNFNGPVFLLLGRHVLS